MELFPREHRTHFAVTESTHSYAVRNGLSLPDGSVITADYQTNGRGRSGRHWSASPRKGLLVSALLREQLQSKGAQSLIHITALSVAELLSSMGMTPSIKWPNDLMVSEKKIAGVLAEASLRGKRIDFAVLSAGINLNQEAAELASIDVPATSVREETGRMYEQDSVLDDFLHHLEKNLLEFFASGRASIMQRWTEFECLTGKRVSLDTGHEMLEGVVQGYAEDGSIILGDGTAEVGRFQAGDIIHAQPAHTRKL